jgi:hypothetical protein
MKNSFLSPVQILAQIVQIQSMERGKLCEYRHAGRSSQAGSYFKLQMWQDGKNHTRHVRPEELPALRDALEGYARFGQLTDQYAQLIVAQTRARLEQDIKKKLRPYSRHCRKKSKDCSSPS